MVDLDSNPTKLIEIVEIGKQLLITRGSLTTFSIANDVAKYFAIIPAMFAGTFPVLDRLNVMRPRQPRVGDPLGGHLQRLDHRRADPARAARRPVPRRLGGRRPAPKPADLRSRRDRRAVHRHQADRPRRRRAGSRLMRRQLVPALVVFLALTLLTGIVVPTGGDRRRAGRLPGPGGRLADRARRPGRGLAADRSSIRRCTLLPPASLGRGRRLRRHGELGLEPRPDERRPHHGPFASGVPRTATRTTSVPANGSRSMP